jgi:hypothetical protein
MSAIGGSAASKAPQSLVSAAFFSRAATPVSTARGRSAVMALRTRLASALNTDSAHISSIRRPLAASAIVEPYTRFSTSRTANSGSQRSSQSSRNVPRPRPTSASRPQGTSSTASRWSSVERAAPTAPRRSIVNARSSASGLSRTALCWRCRSSSNGTSGVVAGIAPTADPISSSTAISSHILRSPPHRQAIVASRSSSNPGAGRSRSAASAVPSLRASITEAIETSWPRSRSARAIRPSHRVSRSAASRFSHRCANQPGATTPAL